MDVSSVDPSVRILGTKWPTPIVKSGRQPESVSSLWRNRGRASCEVARSLDGASTVATSSIEDVDAELGKPARFQLLPPGGLNETKQMVSRAAGGCRPWCSRLI